MYKVTHKNGDIVQCKSIKDVIKQADNTVTDIEKDITLWDAIMFIQNYTSTANTKQIRNGLRPKIENLYEGYIEAEKDGTIVRIVFDEDNSYGLEKYDKNGTLISQPKHYPAR